MRQTCEGGREAQVEREMEKNGELTKKYTKSVLCHTQHLFHHHMRLQPPVLMDFTPSHTLQEVHSALCSVLHSLAHPVGRTMSVEHSQCLLLGLCLWDAACVVRFVYSSWWPLSVSPLRRPAPSTQAWTFNSRKNDCLISSVSTNEIYTSDWTNSFSVMAPWCFV